MNIPGRGGSFTVTVEDFGSGAVAGTGTADAAVVVVVTEAEEDGYAAGLNVDDGHAVVARNNDKGAPLRIDRNEVDWTDWFTRMHRDIDDAFVILFIKKRIIYK